MLMENLLRSKEYWSIVEGGVPRLPSPTTTEQIKANDDSKLKDLKARNYLFQSIDRDIIETILDKESSKSIWDSMKQKFQGTTKVKRSQLRAAKREFELLGMKEEETVTEYFGRILTIVNKMKIYGDKVDQGEIVEKVLRTMTEKFNYVVASIDEGNDVTKMTIDELQGSLLVHEQRMQPQKEEEQALKVSSVGKGNARGRGVVPQEEEEVEVDNPSWITLNAIDARN